MFLNKRVKVFLQKKINVKAIKIIPNVPSDYVNIHIYVSLDLFLSECTCAFSFCLTNKPLASVNDRIATRDFFQVFKLPPGMLITTDLYEIIEGEEEEEMRLYVQKYWNAKNMFVFLLQGHKKKKVYSNLIRKGGLSSLKDC